MQDLRSKNKIKHLRMEEIKDATYYARESLRYQEYSFFLLVILTTAAVGFLIRFAMGG